MPVPPVSPVTPVGHQATQTDTMGLGVGSDVGSPDPVGSSSRRMLETVTRHTQTELAGVDLDVLLKNGE